MTSLERTWSLWRVLTVFATVVMLLSSNLGPAMGEEAQNELLKMQLKDPKQEMLWRNLYGQNQSVDSIKSRLFEILNQRLDTAGRDYELTDVQKKKLELAGRVTIKQLFDSILKFHERQPNNLIQDAKLDAPAPIRDSLRSKLRLGPFDDDSFFAKTLRTMLTREQVAKFNERQQLAATSNRPISVTNATDLMRIARREKDTFEIVWNRDESRLGLLEFDKQIEICSPTTGEVLRVLGEGKRCVHFDLTHDDNLIAIGENSHVATILDLSKGTEISLQTGQPQPSVQFSPDGKTLLTGGYGTKAKLWSVATGEQLREFDVGEVTGGLRAIFSPDGNVIAVGNRNSTTGLFDVATGQWLRTLSVPQSQGLKFAPSGKTLAIAYVSGRLGLWDVESGMLQKDVKTTAEELYSVDWSPDGTVLVTAGHNAHVTLWNASDLSVLRELESPEWVITARFSPDGSKLLFAGGGRQRNSDRRIETWAVP